MHTMAKAVIVGAGVIGCSTALQLAKRGYDVTVVDKAGGPGFGSTSASSAVIRFNYSTIDGVLTAWESVQCWKDWRGYLSLPDDIPAAKYYRTGMVFLDIDIAPRDRTIALYDKAGIEYEEWSSADLSERMPGIDSGRYFPPKPVDSDAFFEDASDSLGALYTPEGGFIDDPQLAAANLAAAAERAGTQFRYNTRIVALNQRSDKVWELTLSDGTTMDSPIVVNAAGPWSNSLNEMAGVGSDFNVSVRPMRQEVHHVQVPKGYNAASGLGPAMADMDLGTYCRPEPGGGFLVGGTEPECDPLEWIDDPDTANLNRTPERFEAQVLRAARRFPQLTVPSQPKGIAGVYDVASDWTPIYDKTDRDGFFVAIGTSGNQFKNAPLAGEFLAAIVEAVRTGHDHDDDPVQYVGRTTGQSIDLGQFSRRRILNGANTGTVLG